MTKRYQSQPPAPHDWVQHYPELHPVVANLLYHLGLREPEAIERFLHPNYERDQHDPWLFTDMKKVVTRLIKARDVGESVQGYGLNMAAVERFHTEGVNLIITVDCGISNAVEVARAADLGMDVIVTDHHVEPTVLPERAFAIINPQVKR